ncbi:MAG: hypothetical protein RBS48_12415, partial [Ignavibacteriaceae bacterium]|nr:hypothetical protein [Ignavibacteriaceae bacterium]
MKLDLDGELANNEIKDRGIENKNIRLKTKFFKPLSSVLIKPAGPDCNLDCDYCFYLEKASLFGDSPRHRMSIDTLEETIKQVMQQSGAYVTFGWQGGEPTLMGLDFFKKIIEFQKKYG